MRELTARQREVLAFIRSFTTRHAVPPTVREIGDRFNVTPRAAFDHLRALERKGMLQRRHSVGRTSRALTLSEPTGAVGFRSVPVLGRVAAGAPLLAEENREGELPVAASSLPNGGEDVFALRVRGDSMVDAHILMATSCWCGGRTRRRPTTSSWPRSRRTRRGKPRPR
jgi:repressor LexA